MFTGIIEEVGTVAELATSPLRQGSGQAGGTGRLCIEASRILAKLEVGSSIAVSGCCLTVTEKAESSFACDLSPETLERTAFRRLQPRAQVNLEAPLTLSQPLGGHIVQGHVDGTGTFLELRALGDGNYWLEVEVPAELTRYLVEKGSVAVEGISLTVAAQNGTRVGAAVIPFTYENTNLRTLQPGDPVNLECDLLAKYVERLLGERPGTIQKKPRKSHLTLERLRKEGF